MRWRANPERASPAFKLVAFGIRNPDERGYRTYEPLARNLFGNATNQELQGTTRRVLIVDDAADVGVETRSGEHRKRVANDR
jgi:hypothetical protein